MQTPKEVYEEAVYPRVKALGSQILARGVIEFRAGGIFSHVGPPDFEELLDTVAAHKAGRAIVVVAEFANKARAVFDSVRLTATGKQEDVRKLATETAPELNALLTEVGAALEAASAQAAKDLAPVPVPPADAAQAVMDVELRQIVRPMPVHDQMIFVRDNYAALLAVMRMPVGFDGQFLAYAQTIWAERNPNAKTMTNAVRLDKSWREARKQIAAAYAAFSKLSSGRELSTPEGRAAADAANAATLPDAA